MRNRPMIVSIIILSIVGLNSTNAAFAGDSTSNVSTTGSVQILTPPSASGSVQVQVRSLNSSVGPQGIAAAALNYGPCTLVPQNIYLRQSFGLGVGSNAATQCTVPVTSISLTISIQKLGFFGWEGGQSWTTYNNNASTLNSDLSAGINCTNFKQTIWSAWMYTTVVYAGVTYTASTTARNGAQQFACGT